jgi:hypothetical protein
MLFNDADFSSAAIDPATAQRQLPYYSWRNQLASNSTLDYSDCRGAVAGGSYADIMPYSTSVSDLQAKINSLVATGATAAHIGTKWGVALLDPAANVIGADMGGDVAAIPAAYAEPGVLKVLVVMTDGQNTDHYELYDDYRSGASDMYSVIEDQAQCYGDPNHSYVWYFENQLNVYPWLADYCGYVQGTNNYIYRPDNAKYYKVGNGSSQGSQYNNLPGNNAATAGNVGYRYNYTWSEVWEFMSTGAFATTINKKWDDIEQTFATASQADTQMTSSCTIAKNRGVVVYTIAFSAPSHAQTLLQGCATSLNNYYDVDTTDIASAFSAIAVSIQKLKLTQ